MSNPDRLRVLLVTPSLPYPPVWGFGIRVYQTLRYLAQRHAVTLVTYAAPDEDDRIAALRQTGADIQVVRRPEQSTGAKRLEQFKSVLSPASYQRQGLQSSSMQALLDRLLATNGFDLIQVESSQMSGFDFHRYVPLIIDEHNIEYELLYRTFKTERSPLRKLYNWIEYQKFRREEQSAWQTADGCVLTSDREEVILRQYSPRTPTTVVPNGVDVEFFEPGPLFEKSDSIVFVGVMHYRPNVDAVIHFVNEILPHIVQHRPNVCFTVVGGGAPEALLRLAGPHVRFTGVVPDTRPYVRQAGAVVVPLRMGSGTRLKVLEGLAMARPVISTSLGAEGIAAVHDQHVLIADDPLRFARSVLRVLDDTELAIRLGRTGRALVEAEYSWTSVLQRLEAFFRVVRTS